MAASISLAKATVIPAVTGPNAAPAYQIVRYVASPDGAQFYDYSVNNPDSVGDANTYLQANITTLVPLAVANGRLIANSINGAVNNNTQVATLYGTTVNPFIWDRILLFVFQFSGTISTPPTITIGTTSGGSQILPATLLANFGALLGEYVNLAIAPIAALTNPAGTPIWVNVISPAIGVNPVFRFSATPIGKNALDF